jgi:O-antigen/teichoic acid export membrane protein
MNSTTHKKPFAFFTGSRVIKSSFWGIAANGIQSVLLSLFFVIMARQYDNETFATFLIATTVYQFMAAFSTLGLGQWFTREIVNTNDRKKLVNKFLKMQIFSGIFFYGVNILIAFILYDRAIIQHLALILGINIIFDNIIYAIRSLNIAEFKQQKTFIILLADSVLKFLAGCALFFFPFSILTLAIILIIIRFVTLNVFLSIGSSNSINIRQLLMYKISLAEVKKIVAPNWAFIIIGSVSMIYWRIGNIIISKMLSLHDVANYEVSYRVFSLALILPLIISTTIFPSLVELNKNNDPKAFSAYIHKVFMFYMLYSIGTYTFFFSFSDVLIPFAFGEQYADNPAYTKEMFLSILVFPTVLLQANVLVAIHKEKADMWLNILSLAINVAICLIGLYFYRSLTVVNYAIFSSFLVFHICQDFLIVKYGLTTFSKAAQFYIITATAVAIYMLAHQYMYPLAVFIIFWLLAVLLIMHFTVGFPGFIRILKNPQAFKLKDLSLKKMDA